MSSRKQGNISPYNDSATSFRKGFIEGIEEEKKRSIRIDKMMEILRKMEANDLLVSSQDAIDAIRQKILEAQERE